MLYFSLTGLWRSIVPRRLFLFDERSFSLQSSVNKGKSGITYCSKSDPIESVQIR